MALPLIGIVFSKDRAMQLDLTLRSFLLHCADRADFPLVIIYRTTNAKYARQYLTLRDEYARFANINFLPEKKFWQNLLAQLAFHADLGVELKPFLHWLWLGRRFSRWRQPLLSNLPSRYVLFLVDDNIFVRDFSLQPAVDTLDSKPEALGFSLRLGANTVYCYTADLSQSLPEFTPIGADLFCYDWTSSELDFGYPLEVSSSVYRIGDLLPWLDRWSFRNPNELESRLADNVDLFRNRPQLICFRQSVTFCNPVNRVNLAYQNRAGQVHPAPSDFLAEKFAAGYRVDAAAYSGFTPRGCHQETAFIWLPHSEENQWRALQSEQGKA